MVAAWQESPVGANQLHRSAVVMAIEKTVAIVMATACKCLVVWCRSVAEHLRKSGSVRDRDSQELQPGSALTGRCTCAGGGYPMTSPLKGDCYSHSNCFSLQMKF